MMESMIEWVAAALAEVMGDENIEGYDLLASAAIAAMREPTKPMLVATEDVVTGHDDFACGDGTLYLSCGGWNFEKDGETFTHEGFYDSAIEAWQAMIDAALTE